MKHGLGPSLLALGSLLCACIGGQIGADSPTAGNGAQGGGGASGIGDPGVGGPGDPQQPPAAAPPTTRAVPTCDGPELPGPRRLRLLTRVEYANTVADLLGLEVAVVDNLPVESVVDGFKNNALAQAVTSRHVDEYLSAAERLAQTAVMQKRWQLATCPGGEACGRTFIGELGRRAFRRPLEPSEVDRYAGLFRDELTGGKFETGMELVIRAMLSSPHFIYRSEMGEKAGETYRLSPYEIATALSYLFWATTPDTALLDAAASGALDTPEGIAQAARRLLDSPRSHAAVAEFFRQWLGTDDFLFTNKDAAVYPSFDNAVREAMVAEQDAFVKAVLWEGTGTIAELLTAGYVVANDALLRFYGLPAGAGATLQKATVDRNAQHRGGLLTLGTVLGIHAHPNESSPVRRGVFVRTRLLCQSLPSPPQNLDVTPPGLDPTLTTRARFARHTEEDVCAGCHRHIDGIGFGFERYDGVGAYREQEAGMPIDASGEILGLEDLNDPATLPFEGPIALGNILAQSPNAQACFARQMFRYARGGENGTRDSCAIAKLQKAFIEGGLDIRQLMIDLVTQESFRTRS